MGFSGQAKQSRLPLWEGHGSEPVPNWNQALGFRVGLIRCLILKMFANFMDAFLAERGNLPVVSDGVCGLGLPGWEWSAACQDLCHRGWLGGKAGRSCGLHGPEPTRLRQACSCSPSRAIPAGAQVMVSFWSLPLEQLQAFDFRGLSGHFSSLQKVHVNTVIKKNGSRGCAEAKNGTEVAQREREVPHQQIFFFLIP